jgi:hypothetical protein
MNPLPLCEWCQKIRVKLPKNKTCSRSCAASLRWAKFVDEGRIKRIIQNREAGKKTQYAKRLVEEIKRNCDELGIALTPQITKLYIRARNKGYHNGFYARDKRSRLI